MSTDARLDETSLDDLIRMKEAAGRPKDLEDLRVLRRLRDHATDARASRPALQRVDDPLQPRPDLGGEGRGHLRERLFEGHAERPCDSEGRHESFPGREHAPTGSGAASLASGRADRRGWGTAQVGTPSRGRSQVWSRTQPAMTSRA